MSWLLRFIGFATLFAIPAFFLSGPWQAVIGRIASAMLEPLGIHVELSVVEIMAPFDVGIYAAMCLASRRAPAQARRRALEWGIPIMIALEVLTVAAAIALYFALARSGESAAVRTMTSLIEFVPWASATTVWLVLLGAWELPVTAALGRANPPRV